MDCCVDCFTVPLAKWNLRIGMRHEASVISMGVQNVLCQCHSVLRFNIQHHWILLWYTFLCRLNSRSNNTIRPYTIWITSSHIWICLIVCLSSGNISNKQKIIICSSRRVEERELTLCCICSFPKTDGISFDIAIDQTFLFVPYVWSIFTFDYIFSRRRCSCFTILFHQFSQSNKKGPTKNKWRNKLKPPTISCHIKPSVCIRIANLPHQSIELKFKFAMCA